MYAFSAVYAALRFDLASLCFERAWNLMKLGIAMAARMPMIATTIISSISVKPLASFFMEISWGWDRFLSGLACTMPTALSQSLQIVEVMFLRPGLHILSVN